MHRGTQAPNGKDSWNEDWIKRAGIDDGIG